MEVLDKYFKNVCELDLIFNFHKVRLGRLGAESKGPGLNPWGHLSLCQLNTLPHMPLRSSCRLAWRTSCSA